ncbi:four-carbon acid sugar kinase family protein [Hoeflea ulvae]|uniref:Four-carbon acid sugar kinase family protein n=1 Tax=Hoeflea ulvae TaxID=2983764 RepID=A0ABT3YMD1_9HYPH|nr:four-carbon acid sugar kinase family protein [Hoeflea ulvae]MCY0096870.1 four-carbon acid sugar kinase family protein [Hoeflea ulvae]
MRPLSVFIGDDFTGASDTLATWARAGVPARLFLDAAEAAAADKNLEVIGIATELRGLSAERIRARASDVAEWVRSLEPRFVHYKVCSTFDSGPETGSIGAAVRAFEQVLDPGLTLVLGGQPSLGRYCLFGTLFARAADGEVYRIDRHPVMRRHPVTPMTEADLAVHLAAQGLDTLQSIPFTELSGQSGPLADLLKPGRGRGPARFLLDAASAEDICLVGAALGAIAGERPVLLVGASSVAEALLACRKSGSMPMKPASIPPANNPPARGAVLSLPEAARR